MAGKIPDLIVPNWSIQFKEYHKWERLNDACSVIVDCPHSTPKYDPQGSCFVARTQDIRCGYFDHRQAERVSRETYLERIQRCEPNPNDILYSREGTYFGDAALVAIKNVCLGQRMVLLRPDTTRYDPKYMVYWLNSVFMQRHLAGLRDGSVAERLNMSTIRSLPIAAPPLPEQQAIAHILGTLDDKIDLNRRMNETLEAMARAIFKSWFIDFDGHTEFEDGELGPIPKGWRVGSVDETIQLIGGGTPKTKVQEYWNGSIPWYSVVDAPSESDVFLTKTEKKITKKGLENSSTKLLRPGTTIISARGTVGKLALTAIKTTMNQSCYAIVGQDKFSDYYTFFSIKRGVNDLKRNVHGAVFDTITRQTFKHIKIPIPPSEIIAEFEQTVAPYMDKIRSNVFQSATLAGLRDTLLPKLLSGEICVPDAEKLVEEAV